MFVPSKSFASCFAKRMLASFDCPAKHASLWLKLLHSQQCASHRLPSSRHNSTVLTDDLMW